MKIKNIVLIAMVSGLFCQPVFAISEAYRAQLERSGCTQVEDANGTCNVKQNVHHDAAPKKTTADKQHAMERNLDSHIAGRYQGQAVDYMEKAGWKSVNAERTRWRNKEGLTADFDMAASGKVAGVIVR